MQQANSVIAATWILAAGVIGILSNVTTIRGAAMVLGLGLVPPVLLMVRWRTPVQARAVRVHRANP